MGLDLLHRVPDELWNEVHGIVQETGMADVQRQSALPPDWLELGEPAR